MADPQENQLCQQGGTGFLPDQPYLALYYHYGMLLGVDDFVTDQAYHRGKTRLHNAWLHGGGAVWGLDVSVDLPAGEIRVERGLAFDGRGRELHNDYAQCLSVGRWFVEHSKDPDFKYTTSGNKFGFDAQVILRHRACLTRPVPALLDTCDGAAASGTTYSRIFETVEIVLKPGKSDPGKPLSRRFHLLRVLLGLEDAGTGDAAARKARDEILAAPSEKRLAVAADALHRMAVLDSLAARPGSDPDDAEAGLFPDQASVDIVLADVKGIQLEKKGEDYVLTKATADNLVRPVLLSTEALQVLAAGVLAANSPATASVGPRVRKAEFDAADPKKLVLSLDQPVKETSLTKDAFIATLFDPASGWKPIVVTAAVFAAPPARTEIAVTLADNPAGKTFRFIAQGTGPKPLLGDNNLPLFGDAGSRPDGLSAAAYGRDFVWMS
jgi:hypothetical protein